MTIHPTPADLAVTRAALRARWGEGEAAVLADLTPRVGLDDAARAAAGARAADLVRRVRAGGRPTIMERFLAEYGLSSAEGVGLMCLAEALLRVPDADTIDDLIADKIEASDWSAHLGRSASPLVNAATWALMITGRVLDDDPHRPAAALRGLVRRAGEPVVRAAVAQAMKLLGRQFVLGETIAEGLRNAAALEAKGYAYSYDMLGEAARTDADARRYKAAYADAIAAIAARASGDVRTDPGISVKLSALHPRYHWSHRDTVRDALTPRALALARQAAAAGVGFNIDAEEQDRLEISLEVIAALMADPQTRDWPGLGIVVQAYGRRAGPLIEHLDALARARGRRIMVRLVKGAYWDGEIKRAQEAGLDDYPVFTTKPATDVSFLACARMLLDRRGRIYPQIATHNAHSCAAVLAMAGEDRAGFEFQRLHGMGEALHEILRAREGARCRIYAPVGAHRDLLAYLVRRLLENGANSSFVNQIVDETVPPERIARDPLEALAVAASRLPAPRALFGPDRLSARGVTPDEPASVDPLLSERRAFADMRWRAAPSLADGAVPQGAPRPVAAPHDPAQIVGAVAEATAAEVARALDLARPWGAPPAERAAVLRRAAELYEAAMGEFCALAAREAGKTLADGVAEVREAVDFLRYYAGFADGPGDPLGVVACVSPWNFPLAIFTGQIAAALAAGNAALAKPAEQTPLIAARAVALLRQAGAPPTALQLLPGDGPTVGAALTGDPRIGGVCFTGSTATAQAIHRGLADPAARLIAETGGLNAMIVDSSALTEQAVRDILASAFQSAGQRCSALRMLYVQREARARLLSMLFGAMDALVLGDPWDEATDVGPVIDAAARDDIVGYLAQARDRGAVLKQVPAPACGTFVGPAVVAVNGIADIPREVFGPVLHVADFEARDLSGVVEAINARGYGLTFGLHTRIDDRVQRVTERIRVGNAYVNRNQIGAIVGSQPFGGEGLSGTGPKAGGPHYVGAFRRGPAPAEAAQTGPAHDAAAVAAALAGLDPRGWAARADRLSVLRAALPGQGASIDAAAPLLAGPWTLPGHTGESNRLSIHPRGPALCLGPGLPAALAQAAQALAAGCATLVAAPGAGRAVAVLRAAGAPVAALDGGVADAALRDAAVAVIAHARPSPGLRAALAAREGPILTPVTDVIAPAAYAVERHLCVDTTAAGGDAALLAAG